MLGFLWNTAVASLWQLQERCHLWCQSALSCHPSNVFFCAFFPPYQPILTSPGEPLRLLPDSISNIFSQMFGYEEDYSCWGTHKQKINKKWQALYAKSCKCCRNQLCFVVKVSLPYRLIPTNSSQRLWSSRCDARINGILVLCPSGLAVSWYLASCYTFRLPDKLIYRLF